NSIRRIERMHLKRCDMDQEPRANEFVMHLMIAQHVADVLTKKAFNAFTELLHTIDILLLHPPRAIGSIRRSRIKWFDCFLNTKVPGNVRDQVFQNWKSFHRLDGYRSVQWQVAETRHA